MFSIVHRIALAFLFSLFLSSCGSSLETEFYLDGSALSYGMFETEADSLRLDVSNTLPEQFSGFADVSIEDPNGLKTYKVQPGESMIVHSMPAGQKRVAITSGGQIKFNGEITGVFINKITFDRAAIPVEPEGKRIVVYGDSLTVGGNTDHLSAEAWPVLLRKHYSVVVEAYGYRALQDDASTPQAREELASKISTGRPDIVWLAAGANDYAYELWSAREFGEAYGATLDAIHAASPGALLFAQSPILRRREDANSFGEDLENYRQQIAAACAARSPWCVFVDGTDSAFPQPEELNKDGIHLTTKSSVKYAEAVLNLIGK